MNPRLLWAAAAAAGTLAWLALPGCSSTRVPGTATPEVTPTAAGSPSESQAATWSSTPTTPAEGASEAYTATPSPSTTSSPTLTPAPWTIPPLPTPSPTETAPVGELITDVAQLRGSWHGEYRNGADQLIQNTFNYYWSDVRDAPGSFRFELSQDGYSSSRVASAYQVNSPGQIRLTDYRGEGEPAGTGIEVFYSDCHLYQTSPPSYRCAEFHTDLTLYLLPD